MGDPQPLGMRRVRKVHSPWCKIVFVTGTSQGSGNARRLAGYQPSSAREFIYRSATSHANCVVACIRQAAGVCIGRWSERSPPFAGEDSSFVRRMLTLDAWTPGVSHTVTTSIVQTLFHASSVCCDVGAAGQDGQFIKWGTCGRTQPPRGEYDETEFARPNTYYSWSITISVRLLLPCSSIWVSN